MAGAIMNIYWDVCLVTAGRAGPHIMIISVPINRLQEAAVPALPHWPTQFVITADLYNELLTTSTTSEAAGLAAGGAGSGTLNNAQCWPRLS